MRGTLGARETIKVLQRQKRLHRVFRARGEIIAELLPASPHFDAGDLEDHHRPDRIPHTSFDASTALYVADRLARDLERPDDAKGISLAASDDPIIEALGLSQQYSTLRERAMELFQAAEKL